MQNYIVCITRTCPEDAGSVSGAIEDAESGQKETFQSFSELKTLLADFIGKGQLEFSDLASQVIDTHKNVAFIG